MDIGVSHTLTRSFFWSDIILWKEDLGDRSVTYSLAGRDLIVNTEAVVSYLASSDCGSSKHQSFNGGRDDYVESDDRLYV
jgi:hypothetical protein